MDHSPESKHDYDDSHEHDSHTSTYVTIFLVLAFLTIVEVYVPEVYSSEWNKHTKMLLLVILVASGFAACGIPVSLGLRQHTASR